MIPQFRTCPYKLFMNHVLDGAKFATLYFSTLIQESLSLLHIEISLLSCFSDPFSPFVR